VGLFFRRAIAGARPSSSLHHVDRCTLRIPRQSGLHSGPGPHLVVLKLHGMEYDGMGPHRYPIDSIDPRSEITIGASCINSRCLWVYTGTDAGGKWGMMLWWMIGICHNMDKTSIHWSLPWARMVLVKRNIKNIVSLLVFSTVSNICLSSMCSSFSGGIGWLVPIADCFEEKRRGKNHSSKCAEGSAKRWTHVFLLYNCK
jgi:hypothetical protein